MFSHDENNNFFMNLYKKKEHFLSSAESASNMIDVALRANQCAATKENSIYTTRAFLDFAIKTLKYEILSQHIEDQYFFNMGERTTTSYMTKTLDAIYDFIVKKPYLSLLGYQELSLSSKEELKAALTYVAHKKKGTWKAHHSKIMEFCALPIERNVPDTQPGEKGFQLLSNSPAFFEWGIKPMDSELITKDDCLIMRIWLPNEKIGMRISFEAQQYSRKGSLFLSPIRQMDDGFQRTFFNDYLSFAKVPNDEDVLQYLPGQGYDAMFDYYKFYQKMVMTTFLKTGMNYFIANVLLKMIADYAEPDPSDAVNTLIALDTELQGSPPDHTFRFTGLNAEKIWERTLEYALPQQRQIHQHILVTEDVMDEALYLLKRAENYNYEIEKKLGSIHSFKKNESKLEKFISILSDLSSPEPKVSRMAQSL